MEACASRWCLYVLLLLFASAAITSNLGVFAIVGGFVHRRGAATDDRRFVEEWKRRVGPIVQCAIPADLLRLYRLRTDIGTIQGWAGFCDADARVGCRVRK